MLREPSLPCTRTPRPAALACCLLLLLAACAGGPRPRPVDPRVVRAREANTAAEKLLEEGRYEEGKKAAEQACKAILEELGAEHVEYAECLTNLGAAFFYLGDNAGARRHMQEALEIRNRALGPEHELVAESIANLASISLAAREHEKAKAMMHKALEMRKRTLGPRDPAVAESLIELGLLLHREGKNERAIELYEQAISIWTKSLGAEDRQVGQGRLWFGMLLQNTGNLERAREQLEKALAINRKILRAGHPDTITNLSLLAGLQTRLGDVPGALESYQRLLTIQEAVHGEDSPQLIEAVSSLGSMLAKAGKYSQALPYLDRAAGLAEKHLGAQHFTTGTMQAYLADCHLALGKLDEAQAEYEEALRILEPAAGADHPWVAYALYGLGRLETRRANLSRAAEFLEKSLAKIGRSLGNQHPQAALVLSALGYVETLSGNYAAARQRFERALKIDERVFGPAHPRVAEDLIGLGQLSPRFGSYDDAAIQLGRALEIVNNKYGKDHILAADIQGYLAEVTLMLGDPYAAANLYLEALAIYDKSLGRDDERFLAAIHNLAHAMAMAKAYENAVEHYAYALGMYGKKLGAAHPWVAQVRCTKGLVQIFAGQHDKGLAECRLGLEQLARALGDEHYQVAQNLRCLVVGGLRSGDVDGARQAAARTLAIVTRNADPLLTSTSSQERLDLFQSRRIYLDTYLSLFDRPGDALDAYKAALRWKGVVMTTLAAQREAALADDKPQLQQLIGELSLVRRRLAEHFFRDPGPGDKAREGWQKKFFELTRRRDELERELAKGSRDIVKSRELLEASVADVCRGLKPSEALVDFLAYRRYSPPEKDEASEGKWRWKYAAFILRPGACDTPQRIELGNCGRIDRAIERYQRMIGSGAALEILRPRAQRLYTLLFEPLASRLKDRRKIWIVPDSVLASVPFEALIDDKGRFLIENNTFGYLSAAQELALGNARRRAKGTGALIVGGIDYGGAEALTAEDRSVLANASGGILPVAALPGTDEEAAQLTGLFEKRRRPIDVVELTGDLASEGRIKRELAGKRFIHLATHGFFQRRNPERLTRKIEAGPLEIQTFHTFEVAAHSGLILAGANETGKEGDEDGLLTAEEVAQANLRSAELVTLSACETGLGTPIAGAGVLGLRRAFFLAGARSIVMSLWKVPDEETRRLMQLFYRRIVFGKVRDKARALRSAKLELIKKLEAEGKEAHPLYWASFIISGH